MYDFISNFEDPKEKEGYQEINQLHLNYSWVYETKQLLQTHIGVVEMIVISQNILEDSMRIYSFLLY